MVSALRHVCRGYKAQEGSGECPGESGRESRSCIWKRPRCTGGDGERAVEKRSWKAGRLGWRGCWQPFIATLKGTLGWKAGGHVTR